MVSFMSQLLNPQGKSSGTYWIGGWEVPIAGLEALAKENKSLLLLELNHPGSLLPKTTFTLTVASLHSPTLPLLNTAKLLTTATLITERWLLSLEQFYVVV
jgi:hypothetical protein